MVSFHVGDRSHEEINEGTGLVMRQDEDIVWIWSPKYPLIEVQFFSNDKIKPGDLVKYTISAPLDQVQLSIPEPIEHDSPEAINHLVHYSDTKTCEFSVLAHVGFPPPNYDIYCYNGDGPQEFISEPSNNKNLENCFHIAHSVQFGKVVSLQPLIVTPGNTYLAWIKRAPKYAASFGTLFVFDNAHDLLPITDVAESNRVLKLMPWYMYCNPHEPIINIDCENNDPFAMIQNEIKENGYGYGSETTDSISAEQNGLENGNGNETLDEIFDGFENGHMSKTTHSLDHNVSSRRLKERIQDITSSFANSLVMLERQDNTGSSMPLQQNADENLISFDDNDFHSTQNEEQHPSYDEHEEMPKLHPYFDGE